MDAHLLAIALRELERLLVVGGGILSIFFGYRLFIALPALEASGSGRLLLPGGVSIFLSRIGPGVFFALFGTGILVFAMQATVTVGSAGTAAGPASPAPALALAPAAHYSGMSSVATVADAERQQTERTRIVGTVRGLRLIEATLQAAHKGRSTDDALRALDEAKFALMRGTWHEADWGRLDEFEAWRNAGMPAPPPPSIAQAARILTGATP
ncbi:hypothetical protein [Rubrivivax sp. A210]|uniref:hypothetical protein n=1 Tax=Rubrivivax sp. A210 TaxID=2772301 RepID=UPI00191A84A7|nr:hypothetical protein [Rubrivivax sp. A210]